MAIKNSPNLPKNFPAVLNVDEFDPLPLSPSGLRTNMISYMIGLCECLLSE